MTSPSSPSPSFLKAVGCATAFLVFPILATIWTIKCIMNDRSEQYGFEILAIFGTVELFGMIMHFTHPKSVDGSMFAILGIAYLVTWAGTLLNLARVKDEIEQATRKTATR